MPDKNKLTRRRLLAGGAAAGASLPVLHAVVPHSGIHRALDGAQAAEGGPHGAHGGSVGPFHAGYRDGPDVDHAANGFDPSELLREFDTGRTRRVGGRTVREWDIVAEDREIEVAPGVKFASWTYNGRVPGPTLRCTEGERLRINFVNGSDHPHTMHFHGIHTAAMDGMPGVGEAMGGGQVEPGEAFTYEFDAEPFGFHIYHCHVSPLADHIAKGLYGAFLIDPAEGRPEADEMVMLMNGFDTNFDRSNEVYAVNSVGFHYMRHPIRVKRGQMLRIYLANLTEFDPVNSMHVHANFFQYYPTGTSLEPSELTDTIILGQGQRGILEMAFPFSGRYMFHAHVTEFAELGWTGFFEVID